MLLKRIVSLAMLLSTYCPLTFGQEYPYIHYTPKDGLANSRIRNIYQDYKGRLFFMTANGLSIYDGARFINYTTEQGMPDPIVNDVIEVGPDSLLVAVNTSRLMAWVRGKIVEVKTSNNYCPVINRFFRASNGVIYAATDQGFYYFRDRTFHHIFIPDSAYRKKGLAFDNIQQVGDYLILRGVIDIEAPGGIYLFNIKTNKLDTSLNQPFHSIVEIPEKNAIVCFTVTKIVAFDYSAFSKGRLKPIPIPAFCRRLEKSLSNVARRDSQGNFWCCHYNAVTRIDRDENEFLLDKTTGLNVNNISGVFNDREGVLWIMTDGSGVFKLVNKNLEIVTGLFGKSSTGINAMSASQLSDTTWLYNYGVHSIYGSAGKKIFQYPLDTSLVLSSLLTDAKNGFYLLNDSGIYSATFRNGRDKMLHVKRLYKDTLILNYARAIRDKEGTIYVPGSNLLAFNPGKINFLLTLPYYADQLCFDKYDNLWLTTRDGHLLCYEIERNDKKHFLRLKHDFKNVIPPINPRSIVVDSTDNVWVGTRYKGLYRFQFKDSVLVSQSHFTTLDGLTDNFVCYLMSSGKNTIWVGTQSGLDRVSMKNGRFKVEAVTRTNNVFEFIHAISISKDHKVWARGASGSTMRISDKEDKPDIKYTPTLQITSIKTPDSTFPYPADELAVDYDQNNLVVEVSAPSFIDERQILFSYMLRGRGQEKWSNPSHLASFNFVNLPAGNYTLLIRAQFPNADYPQQQIAYQFVINPPWWQTWWFKLATALLAIAVSIILIQFYVRRRLEKQKMAMEKQQAIEKERTRIASDMHDDLGAGLSTIRFLGEKINRTTAATSSSKTDIDKIVINSNELVQKMNEIIWAMNEKNDSLEDLLFYTRSYAAEYCEERNLHCQVQVPENLPDLFVSGELRRNVFLTVKESLHNIVKHADATEVRIIFTVDESLHVAIIDNGKGMQKPTSWHGGNGLLNMKKRIELLGGNIAVKNGNGVTLQFDVPLRIV